MNDTDYIRRSIELARRGTALTSPGAMVGAVVVKDDAIVGEGFYTYDGIEHAETIALRQAGDAGRGSTVYTSLEPCSHTGRRPVSCALALIEARVARLWPPGPHALGLAAARVAEAIGTSARQAHTVLTVLGGEFGVRNRVGLVPCLLGPAGIREVRLPPLNARERVQIETALGA